MSFGFCIAGVLFGTAGLVALLQHDPVWIAFTCIGLLFTTLGVSRVG